MGKRKKEKQKNKGVGPDGVEILPVIGRLASISDYDILRSASLSPMNGEQDSNQHTFDQNVTINPLDLNEENDELYMVPETVVTPNGVTTKGEEEDFHAIKLADTPKTVKQDSDDSDARSPRSSKLADTYSPGAVKGESDDEDGDDMYSKPSKQNK